VHLGGDPPPGGPPPPDAQGAHAAFCRRAYASVGSPQRPVGPVLSRFQAALASAWQLPCDNTLKETLWRLAVDAVPGARVRPWACPGCAAASPAPRPCCHTFWSCSIAQAVVAQLQSGLATAGSSAVVSQPNVWLLEAPAAFDCPAAWRLVALAALTAMEYGRRRLWVQTLQPGWVAAHGPAAAQAIGRAATARFWVLLQGFCFGAGASAVAALPGLSANTPFLALADGSVVLRRPTG
jgi:hypothetical protein